MSEEEFEAELQFATSMREEPDSLYWGGYRRGLLRARFGRRVSSIDNHSAWRAFKVDADPILAELGRGYVDGINTVTVANRSDRHWFDLNWFRRPLETLYRAAASTVTGIR